MFDGLLPLPRVAKHFHPGNGSDVSTAYGIAKQIQLMPLNQK